MTGFNARNCPIMAPWTLAFRAEFGDDVLVTRLDENAVTHGKPSQGNYIQPVIETAAKPKQ